MVTWTMAFDKKMFFLLKRAFEKNRLSTFCMVTWKIALEKNVFFIETGIWEQSNWYSRKSVFYWNGHLRKIEHQVFVWSLGKWHSKNSFLLKRASWEKSNIEFLYGHLENVIQKNVFYWNGNLRKIEHQVFVWSLGKWHSRTCF